MPSDTAAQRLARRARQLKPELNPYYMHNPQPGRERYGQGWYWIPPGGRDVEFLAVDSMQAAIRLHELAADAEQAAA